MKKRNNIIVSVLSIIVILVVAYLSINKGIVDRSFKSAKRKGFKTDGRNYRFLWI